MQAWLTGARWTKSRLCRAGYVLKTSSCDLCGAQGDTLNHRVRCSKAEELNAQLSVTSAVLEQAAAEQPSGAL